MIVGHAPILDDVARGVSAAGIRVIQCVNATEALHFIKTRSVWVLVLLDHFDNGTGLELAASSRVRGSGSAVVLIYNATSVPDIVLAIRSGAELRLFPHGAKWEEVSECTKTLFHARIDDEAQRADRREFPRILPEGVQLEAPADAELIDVAPGGLAFRVEGRARVNSPLDIVIRVGRAVTLRLRGDSVRQSRDDSGRQSIAVRFIDPPARASRMLVGLSRRHLAMQGPREIQKRFKETSSADVVPIATPKRIEAFLRRAAAEELSFTLQGATGGSTWQTPILALDRQRSQLAVRPSPRSAILAPGQTLDFLLLHELESYLFEARVASVNPEWFSCDYPQVIYYSEKRSRIRHELPYAHQLCVRLRDPRTHDQWLEFPLLEVSSTGGSFLADLESTLILPGSVFDPLAIAVGDTAVLRERSEVRHVTPQPNSKLYKVGVRFNPRRRLQKRNAEHSLRSTLEGVSTTSRADHAQLVKFLNSDGEELAGLLNHTLTQNQFEGPAVLMLPSWGHSKESFCGYALNLIESFERTETPVAVLRMDYSHHKGESFIPKCNRTSGRESLEFVLSRALGDAQAAIDYCFNNPLFSPTSLTLVAPSFIGQFAIRLASLDRRLSHLILPMSTPSTRELLQNASGGLDYIGGAQRGVRFGVVDFLGLLVDMDRVAADAIATRIAFINDAEDDIGRIECPITWLLGKHDAWINPAQVEHLLQRAHRSQSELVLLDVGHLPTQEESLRVAAEVSRATMLRLGLDPAQVPMTAPAKLEAIQRDEWARAPREHLSSSSDYWKKYLLGETGEALGFDVLAYTDAYQDFAATQVDLLQLRGGETLLDAGAGTGQFAARLVAEADTLPRSLELLDLVPGALQRARKQLEALPRSSDIELRWHIADLEASRLTPVQRFIEGEYHGIQCLRNRIGGLTHDTIDLLEQEYRSENAKVLHRLIRGELPSANDDLRFLDEPTALAVTELGRAARFLQNRLVPADLNPEHALEGRLLLNQGDAHKLTTRYLEFSLLQFENAAAPRSLPLVSSSYDRIVCSLVLPYLLNPDETLKELIRALRPGGVIVISTMKPDTDISLLQQDLMTKTKAGRIQPPPGSSGEWLMSELRAYMSAAAQLLRLTEEGTFNFLRRSELRKLLEAAGMLDVQVRPCFGVPPQAYVAAGRKPRD